MAGSMDLSIIVKLIDQMSAPLRAMQAQLDAFARGAEKLRNVGLHMQQMGAMAAATSAGTVAGLGKIVNAYAGLEDATTRAEVAFMGVGGAVDATFEKIRDQAVELGNRLPGTTRDFMQMAAALKEAGLSSQTIAGGGLEATAYLRVLMGNLAPEQAAQLTATFKNSLGIAEKDFVAFVDVVQRQKFAFGVDPQSFQYAVKYFGGIAQQLGMSGLDATKMLAPMVGMMQQVGIAGETAGTSLRHLFADSLPRWVHNLHSKEIAEIMPKLRQAGIDPAQMKFFDEKGKFAGLGNMVAQLERLRGLDQATMMQFVHKMFGSEAMPVVMELIKQGVDGFNGAADKMAAQATLQQRVAKVLETFRNQWEAAMGTVENTLAAAGALFGDDLKAAATAINDAAAAVQGWIEANPELARTLGIVAVAVTGFMAAAGAIGLIGGTIISGLGMIGGAIAALASPITLIVAAIAGMGYLIYRNWDQVKAAFAPVMAAMGPLVDAFARLRAALFGTADGGVALERLGQVANRVFGFMINYLSTMWTFIAKWVTAWVNAIAGVIEVLSGGSGKISDVLRAIFRAFDQAFDGSLSKFLSAGRDLVRGLAQGLKEGGHVVLGEIADFAANIITKFTGLLGIKSPSRVFAGFGGDLMMGLLQGIKGMAGAVIDEIANVGTNLVNKFTGLLGIKSPSRVFAGFGGDLLAGLGLGIDAGTAAATERMAGAARGVAKAGAAALAMGAVGMASPALAAPMGLASPALAAQAGMAPGAAPGGGASGAIAITINLTVNAGAGADGAAIGGAVRAAAPDMAQQLAAILRRQDRTRY